VQLYLDAFTIGLMSIMFIWFSFLDKDYSIVNRISKYDFTSISAMALDFIMVIVIIALFLSVRSGKIALFLKLIACGLLLFCFSDIVFYYTDIHNLYLPNSQVDFTYILSLQLISLGALFKVFGIEQTNNQIQLSNIGTNKKWLFMFLYPILAILFASFDIIKIKLTPTDFIIFSF